MVSSKTDKIFTFKRRYIVAFLLLFVVTGISAAEMPDYQRLAPITSSITSPTAVAVDSNENIYVSESINNRVLIYSHLDEYVDTLSGLNKPISVAVDGTGRIFVGNHYDTLAHKGNVEVYDSDLEYLFSLGIGNEEFSMPNSIAIESGSGNVYVADKVDNLIKVYNSDGSFNFSFDGTSNGGAQFVKPTSIVIDRTNGDLIVLDRPLEGSLDGARIQIYNMSGGFKSGFIKYGRDVGLMYKPRHITVDKVGRIYVSDTQHNVVLVYERGGIYLGAVYDQDNPLRIPKGVTINNGNRIFVVSFTLRKVEVFGLSPYIQMDASPLSLTFDGEREGAAPALQGVEISNSGTGTLNWTAETDDSWITLPVKSGVTLPSSGATLNVGIDLGGLAAGSHTGSVRIISESGVTEVVNVELAVTETPLIIITGGPYSGEEGEIITLDASGSSGNITKYEWDIDNDGIYDYINTEPTQDHVFTEVKTHFIKLRITNDLSDTEETTTTATISDAKPTAEFIGSELSGEAPLTVNFTNESTGHDQSLTYMWDFDNDGTTDSTDENPSHLYGEVDTYSVKLTVTDSDESVNTLIKADYITVSAGCQNSLVKIGVDEYATIQDAYNAALDGDTIQSRAASFAGPLNINRDISVSLIGGHNCDFNGIEGQTTINGNMTTSMGTLIIENIILN